VAIKSRVVKRVLLHNLSALRLKGRLLFESGVMVTSVPWQLEAPRDRAASAGQEVPLGRG
jgi:hypothetical protein